MQPRSANEQGFTAPEIHRRRSSTNRFSGQFHKLPLTTKDELVEDQRKHPPVGTDLTFPADRYGPHPPNFAGVGLGTLLTNWTN